MRINEDKLKNEIYKLSRDFYKIKSFTDYRVKSSTIAVLYEAYTNLTGEVLDINIPEINYYIEKMYKLPHYMDEIMDEYFNNQKEHNKLSGNVLSTYNRSRFKEYNLEKGTSKINKQKQIELIRDFLNDLSPSIYKEFNYLIMNNLIDDIYKPIDSNVTYFDHYKAKPYIMIEKSDNIFDVDVLMHELGHAYAIKMLENKSREQSLTFTRSYHEMISMYMELSFQDYLKKNHLYLRDAYILENSFYTYMYYYFSALKACNKLKDDDTLCIHHMEYIDEAFIYSYGHYLALRVHDKKMKDEAGVNEALNDFLSYQGLLTYDEQLSLFGLNRDNLNDMKVLKKRLNNHTEELKKYIKD